MYYNTLNKHKEFEMLEVNNETVTRLMSENRTFDEAVRAIAYTNSMRIEDVEEELADEAYHDSDEDLYEHETNAENAWLRSAEYCPEAQADLYDRVVL